MLLEPENPAVGFVSFLGGVVFRVFFLPFSIWPFKRAPHSLPRDEYLRTDAPRLVVWVEGEGAGQEPSTVANEGLTGAKTDRQTCQSLPGAGELLDGGKEDGDSRAVPSPSAFNLIGPSGERGNPSDTIQEAKKM